MNATTFDDRSVLEASGVSLAFGGLRAVEEFDLRLPNRGLYGLIGPNGAGKTTIFNLMTGVYRPDAGRIRVDGIDMDGLAPHAVTAAGVARTFQNIRLFGDLTVLDNVRVAAQIRTRAPFASIIARSPRQRQAETAVAETSLQLLELFGLRERAAFPARHLCYGDQRRLEIVRALVTRPKVLLLDEPAAGMNAHEKRALTRLVRTVRDEFGVAVLLIEHDMELVMDLCEQITVLDHGRIIAHGTPQDVQKNPAVISAYLGVPLDDCSPVVEREV